MDGAEVDEVFDHVGFLVEPIAGRRCASMDAPLRLGSARQIEAAHPLPGHRG